jgi:hypothetical protein
MSNHRRDAIASDIDDLVVDLEELRAASTPAVDKSLGKVQDALEQAAESLDEAAAEDATADATEDVEG